VYGVVEGQDPCEMIVPRWFLVGMLAYGLVSDSSFLFEGKAINNSVGSRGFSLLFLLT